MKRLFTLPFFLMASLAINAQNKATVSFEDATLGDDGTLKGVSYAESGFVFENYYSNEGWEYNSGFTVSNNNDRSNGTFTNQYSVDARCGATGSKQFAVFNTCYYGNCYIRRTDNSDFRPLEVALALTTYTSICVQEGDAYTKKFGKDDFFTVSITGLDADGLTVGSIDIKLVDYPMMWMPWAVADLSELGTVNKLLITFSSSDNGAFGMNTPAYIALDNFTADIADTVVSTSNGLDCGKVYTIDGRQQSSATINTVNIVNGKKLMID